MSAIDDLRALIAAAPGATTVSFGSDTTPCLIDYDGQAWGPDTQAQIGVEVIILTYPYPDLPGLLPGSEVAIDGATYSVSRGPRRRGDGLEAVVILEAL